MHSFLGFYLEFELRGLSISGTLAMKERNGIAAFLQN